MARGESPKDRPISIGLAIMAIVGVASLCTVFSVVSSIHTGAPATPYTPPPPTEPFRGATIGFATLSSRDSARAITTGGAALPRNPAAARSALEATLRDRGYVVGTSPQSAPAALPLRAAALDLEGACGVVLVLGDVSTTIVRAGIDDGVTFRAVDPSGITIAACGPASIRVEGTGQVTYATWLFPGLTPNAVVDTGLGADALLAHAEAELVLRRRGYVPVDEIVEVTPTTTSAGGFVTLPLPITPTAGCIPFVAYVDGAGRPQLPAGRFDFLDDRGLSAAIACAPGGLAWLPTYVDDGTIGAHAFVRAYGAGAPAATPSLTIAGAHRVDAAHATWPTALMP